MGTIIKSVAIAKPFMKKDILNLTYRASKRCLKNAGKCIEDVGMLINSGVYTENHIREPAFAALLQKRLQKKPCVQNLIKKEFKNIFSFDFYNGGGGVLNIIQIIDGFIQSGEIENGLVVAGDTKPVSGSAENYNYSSGAGAIFLSKKQESIGFVKFETETFPEFVDDYKSTTNWDTGRFRFIIYQKKDFLKNCVECAIQSMQQFLKEAILNWSDIDLVITSVSPKGFGKELQHKLGLKDKIVRLNDKEEIFSAGVIFSLNKVFSSQKFKSAKNILFVTVGAGITVSLSLYKQ